MNHELNKCITAFRAQNFETAIDCLARAMEQEPDNPLPCAYLSFVCAQQALTAEAGDFIRQALRIAPDRADLVAALGESFLSAKQPVEAAIYLQEAVQSQPDLFAAYPALAQSLRSTDRYEEAIALLRTVALIPSSHQSTLQNLLLQMLLECGDLSEFAFYAQRASPPDYLLAARCLARFEETGEPLLEMVSHIRNIWAGLPSCSPADSSTPLTRIAFMVSRLTSAYQFSQLFSLFLNLPTDRFFTILVTAHKLPTTEEGLQMCGLLADSIVQIAQDEDERAAEKILAARPDILIHTATFDPSAHMGAFLSVPVRRKFMWDEAPMPSIAPDVATLTGTLPGMGEVTALPGLGEGFDLPELPFTNESPQAVFGCLVPAAHVARNGWQLMARTLRQIPGTTLVINLEALGHPAQTFICSLFERQGVGAERLIFTHLHKADDFCQTWQCLDVGLLPPVHPGGLALPTCLWMGRPCIAMESALPWAQRPGAWLRSLGKEQWIARDAEHYAEIARSAVSQPPDPTLRDPLRALSLSAFAAGFAQTMEAA